MKAFLRSISKKIVSINIFWKIINNFFPLNYLKLQRRIVERDAVYRKEIQKYIKYFPDHIVKNGPFAGMKYPDFKSVGSALFPKLLGSYEKEIHPFFHDIFKKKYSEIIDVGCAEGYYAVGLSIIFPNAKVYAYDINSSARLLCKKMAKINNVSRRVTVRSFFSHSQLANFTFNKKGLIICDCEGYEAELFQIESIKNLKKCDLIIELHDFKKPGLTKKILNLFSITHDAQIVDSIDDFSKVELYDYSELKGLSNKEKFDLVKETRPQMSWVYLTSK